MPNYSVKISLIFSIHLSLSPLLEFGQVRISHNSFQGNQVMLRPKCLTRILYLVYCPHQDRSGSSEPRLFGLEEQTLVRGRWGSVIPSQGGRAPRLSVGVKRL